jgi:hypothetical protein
MTSDRLSFLRTSLEATQVRKRLATTRFTEMTMKTEGGCIAASDYRKDD